MTDTANSEALVKLLASAGVNGGSLTSGELESFWRERGRGASPTEFMRAVVQSCSPDLDDATIPADVLGLQLGSWRIDLTKQTVQAGLLTAIAATSLVGHGFSELGIVFTTAVLPAVFDIQRIELSAGDRRLLVELRVKDALTQGYATSDELYSSLPAATRQHVNPYDFADFVERLEAAGLTDKSSSGTIRLLGPDEHGQLFGR